MNDALFMMPQTLVSLPVGSMIAAFGESNLSGKIICIILFLGSILAWTIIITKIRVLGRADDASDRFLSIYRKDAHPLAVFLKRQRFDTSPIYAVYENTCRALGDALEVQGANPSELFMGGVGSSRQKLSETEMNAIRNVALRTLADQALLMESSMIFLATAVTTAPFLGLLGTVWGILDAFLNVRRGGLAMLPEVAPGISGALLTTVVGLLVALPSAIGYNVIAGRIRESRVRMDNFMREFMSDIDRHFLKTGE